jgi:hypothetical protein
MAWAESKPSLCCHKGKSFPFLLSSTESTSCHNGNGIELEYAPITSSRERNPYKWSRWSSPDRIFHQTELQTLSVALACYCVTGDLLAPNYRRPYHLQRSPHPFDCFTSPTDPWNTLTSSPKLWARTSPSNTIIWSSSPPRDHPGKFPTPCCPCRRKLRRERPSAAT